MPAAFYDLGRQGFAEAAISWTADTIQTVFIHVPLYTVNLVTHQFLSDVPVGARVGTPQTLASKTASAGVLDADDVLFTALTGPMVGALIIFKWTGADATSRLIIYNDLGIGFGFTPSNLTVPVQWSNTATRIAKL